MNKPGQPRPHRRIGCGAGFTLAEVLVAMAVLALAVTALVKGAGEFVSNTNLLRDRTLAQWVASNRLTELQLERAWPDTGKVAGEESMGGTTWYWRQTVSKTPDPDLRRVDLEVSLDEDGDSVANRLSGFLGNPTVRLPR